MGKAISQTIDQLNPTTSISLSTPPQLITNNLSLAPPQKKVNQNEIKQKNT